MGGVFGCKDTLRTNIGSLAIKTVIQGGLVMNFAMLLIPSWTLNFFLIFFLIKLTLYSVGLLAKLSFFGFGRFILVCSRFQFVNSVSIPCCHLVELLDSLSIEFSFSQTNLTDKRIHIVVEGIDFRSTVNTEIVLTNQHEEIFRLTFADRTDLILVHRYI